MSLRILIWMAFFSLPLIAKDYQDQAVCLEFLTASYEQWKGDLVQDPNTRLTYNKMDELAKALSQRTLARKQRDQAIKQAGIVDFEMGWAVAQNTIPSINDITRAIESSSFTFLELPERIAAQRARNYLIASQLQRTLMQLKDFQGFHPMAGTALASYIGREKSLTLGAIKEAKEVERGLVDLTQFTAVYWEKLVELMMENKTNRYQRELMQTAYEWSLFHYRESRPAELKQPLTAWLIDNDDEIFAFSLDMHEGMPLRQTAHELLEEEQFSPKVRRYLERHLQFLTDTGLPPNSIFERLVFSANNLCGRTVYGLGIQ